MNRIDEKKNLKKAKRKYKTHKWLSIYVKKNASNPYKNSVFEKIIRDSKKPLYHKNFLLFIHDKYLTISSKAFTFEPVRIELDNKLWIELNCVFNLSDEEIDLPKDPEVV